MSFSYSCIGIQQNLIVWEMAPKKVCFVKEQICLKKRKKMIAYTVDYAMTSAFLTACISTLSWLGQGSWCTKATTIDWKVWHLAENRDCWPAQCWVSKTLFIQTGWASHSISCAPCLLLNCTDLLYVRQDVSCCMTNADNFYLCFIVPWEFLHVTPFACLATCW